MKIKTFIKNCLMMYYVKEMIFLSPCKRALIRLGAYSSFMILAFMIFTTIQILANRKYEVTNQISLSKDLKYILFWNKRTLNGRINARHQGSRLPEGQSIFIKQGCKFINCFITYNQQLLSTDPNNVDAVVFDVKHIGGSTPKHITLKRSHNQKYIFHSSQSSEKYPICDSYFDSFFNWTWTYKLDSDIPQPFFNIYDASNNLVGPRKVMNWTTKIVHTSRFSKKISSKTKAIAWIVNKCKSKVKYQDFVRDLEKELQSYNYTLDIFGICGNIKCPGFRIVNCFKMIEKNYFFELIIEDTFAKDYVSEKMANTMTHIAIPIILGTSNYKNFLPPGSYINAQTFDMKKLGAIIDYLIRNPTTYTHFFDWKNYYYYTPRPRFQVCELCEKFNTYNITNTPIIKSDLRKWWNPNYRGACLQKHFNKLSD